MRKVFSSAEVSETRLVRDALLRHGIDVTIPSEYSGQNVVPAFRPPAEIWVRNDEDYDRARQVVVETIATLDRESDAPPWTCAGCGEENPPSFEVCWSCGHEKGTGRGRN